MPSTDKNYTRLELLAVASSRILEDRKTFFVGIGLPMVAAGLAQRTHAPNMSVIFEGGIIAPEVKSTHLPLSTQEVRCARKAVAFVSTLDIFLYQQRGFLDYGVLGAAQVDRYGNVNTSVIGDFERPKVRLTGGGGANDIASCSTRIILSLLHEKRRFVEKVDFITSPGYLRGGESRRESGLLFGEPYSVVTDMGIMGFDPETKRMKVLCVHDGVTVEQVAENTGFELLIPERVDVQPPPTEKELSILRSLDPERKILGE